MNRQSTNPPTPRAVAGYATCPLCGRRGVTTSWKDHTFGYGSGKSEAELTVNVPVRRCSACEFEYLDQSAERLKDDAVYRHLGVPPPGEVRVTREGCGMTQARPGTGAGLPGLPGRSVRNPVDRDGDKDGALRSRP